MGELHVFNEGFLVFVPFGRKLGPRWVLAARQLQGDLEAVGENVVEVLHATGQVIPICSVGDTVRECLIAVVAVFHDWMVLGISTC